MLQEGKKTIQFKNKFYPLTRGVFVKIMIINSNYIILRSDKARLKH